MLHFSCDVCGRVLGEERYSVRIDVAAEHDDAAVTDADLETDHLEHLGAVLDAEWEAGQTGELGDVSEDRARAFAFDLCPPCRDRYVNDPLGRETLGRLRFSQN